MFNSELKEEVKRLKERIDNHTSAKSYGKHDSMICIFRGGR